MTGFQRQCALDIDQGLAEIFRHVVDCRTPVPAFRISRLQDDHCVQEVQRQRMIVSLDRLAGPRHQHIHRITTRIHPEHLDFPADTLGFLRIVRFGEIGKEFVQTRLLVFRITLIDDHLPAVFWKIVGKCIEVFGRRWLCFRTEIWNRLGAG